MAKNNPIVLLGFEDEQITEKYREQLSFTVNKIGGNPDYPSNMKMEPPTKCPLCQLPRPLVVQIYAPLDNFMFHRTLYMFACINPNCWNLSESWLCIRVQTQEKMKESIEETEPVATKKVLSDWCIDADDWDDENNTNLGEENGNVSILEKAYEQDESFSFENSIRSSFGNLSIDDWNANKGAQVGAEGRLHSPLATAEIEDDESEVVVIDTPIYPQYDVASLLREAAPVPHDIIIQEDGACRTSSLQFTSSFMAVWLEEAGEKNYPCISDMHVKELLQDYQQKSEDHKDLSSPNGGGAAARVAAEGYEKYEKSIPAHGDKMFHYFLSTIQANHGQILRYCRESRPILLHNLNDFPMNCQYCQSDMVFELQLLPTIISKLKLTSDPKQVARLEFGTILIYTCRNSCWSTDADFRVETVILQTEHD